ncbi:MAG: peptidylprolyl isomerase [Saprospiraceae bacterium]|nr:peptidylprolyl isomerase [Saprospiraceae bacterium]
MKQLMKMKTWLVLFSMIQMSYAQNPITVDKIIAKVGGEIILYSDWRDQIAYISERQGSISEEEHCEVLENLLFQKFMVHQAKLDSVAVLDEEIEQQLSARIDQILQYMNNDVSKFEEYYGQSIEQVRSRFRDDLKNQMLSERLQNKVLGNITVTPNEVQEFFSKIPKDSIPYFSSEVEISEIIYKPKANPDEIKNAKEKLEKILARIKAGEDFEKLAKIHSDDVGSAKSGGNLGWMKRGSLVPQFEAVAFGLEKDSISDIVETEFGYHIIQLLGRRGNNINTRHILVKVRYTETDYTKANQYLDSIRSVILRDSIPFETAVRNYSDKNSETYNNGGQILNPKTGNAYFEVADLDPDIYFATDGLKPGELSKVIASNEPDGKKVFRIVKLVSRSTPHRANLQQDYHKIQTAAKEMKKNEHFRIWLEQKIPSVYSYIEPTIKTNCPNLQNWGNPN